MSIARLANDLRKLTLAHIARTLQPKNDRASEFFAVEWCRFRENYPHVHSGRLAAIVYEHGNTRIGMAVVVTSDPPANDTGLLNDRCDEQRNATWADIDSFGWAEAPKSWLPPADAL